jgi:hypothetical protein
MQKNVGKFNNNEVLCFVASPVEAIFFDERVFLLIKKVLFFVASADNIKGERDFCGFS